MIQIKDFYKGQSASPYVGNGAYSKSSNLDVFGQYGVARSNYTTTTYSGTGEHSITDLPINFAIRKEQVRQFYFSDNSYDVYYFDGWSAEPMVYKIGDNKGNYIAFGLNGWLFAVNKSVINCYDGEDWSVLDSSFTSIGTDTEHFVYNSPSDGKVYFCGSYSSSSGRYGLAALYKKSGFDFDPTTSNTYNWEQNAFSLPQGFYPTNCIDAADYLLIAAIPYPAFYNKQEAYTTYFLWDRSSSTAARIMYIPEANMTTFIRNRDSIYITGGTQGNIYRYTESGFSLFTKLPFDYDGKEITIGKYGHQSGAVFRDNLLLGVSSEDTLSPAGIYSIKDNTINHEYLPSHGDDGSTNDVLIGGVYTREDDTLTYGWKRKVGDTETFGIDLIYTTANRGDGWLESLFYSVGTKSNPVSFDRTEIILSKPLRTGEEITIKYRGNTSDSWTTLGSGTYATLGAVNTIDLPGIHSIIGLQVKVEITATTTSPEILEIRLL